ncbi:NifU family protein [Streptomyces sp. NBC_00433]
MTAQAPARDAERAGRRVEEVLDRLAATGDRAACAAAEDLVRALMDFYGAGLARVLALTGQAGPRALERLLGDDLVSGMLVLHDLHPEGVEARIGRALRDLPGGPAELVGFDQDTGVLRLRSAPAGGCGCGSTPAASGQAVEDALACFAGEVTRVEFEPAAAADGPVLLQITPRPGLVSP